MVEAQGAGAVFEVLLEKGDGLVEPPGCLVSAGEVAARGQGLRMVGTRETYEVGEVLLKEGDGFVQSARIPVGASEAVA